MDLPEDVVIRRSARRKRTLQARREGGKIVVLVPSTLPAREYDRLVPKLIERVRAREAGGRRRSDAALEQAATRLAKELAADLNLLPRLTSVTITRRACKKSGRPTSCLMGSCWPPDAPPSRGHYVGLC